MSPKPRHSFDDESPPRKTPAGGTVVPPAGSGSAPAVPAGEPAKPALKRITSLVAKPVELASAPVVSSPLLGQLASQQAIAPPKPAEPAAPAFMRGAVETVALSIDAGEEPRLTTFATTVAAELGATFISGRVKLQLVHFPRAGARRRVLMLNEIPGTQQNLDLALALWRADHEVVIMHNRGEAGSDGLFSLKGIETDIRQAMQSTVETGHRDKLWKSSGPVLLIGCGLNAPSICGVAAEDERLAGVVLIDPYVEIPTVLKLEGSPLKPQDLYAHMQSGVVNMVGRENLNEEWEYLAQSRNPLDCAARGGLDHMPLLHVTSDRSVLAPMGKRFSAAMRSRNAPLYQHVHLPGSVPHFWKNRQELLDVVLFWIGQLP